MALPPPSADRTALVTGASSGIGVELARELARRGHGVTLVARRKERLTELAEELTATGVRAEALDVDLSDRAARAGLPTRIIGGPAGRRAGQQRRVFHHWPAAPPDVDAELDMSRSTWRPSHPRTRFVGGISAGRGAVLNIASTAASSRRRARRGTACKAFVLLPRALGGSRAGPA